MKRDIRDIYLNILKLKKKTIPGKNTIKQS